jgi:hypothetical protein
MRRMGLVTAAVLMLASCGSDGGVPQSAVLTASAETTAATTAGETPDVVAMDVDPCTLLDAADVEAITGFAVTGIEPEGPVGCLFRLDVEQGAAILVVIEDGMGRMTGAANLYQEYDALVEVGEAELVAGVGAGAVCCPFRAMAVDAGAGRFVVVAVHGGYTVLAEPKAALTALAESVLGRL